MSQERRERYSRDGEVESYQTSYEGIHSGRNRPDNREDLFGGNPGTHTKKRWVRGNERPTLNKAKIKRKTNKNSDGVDRVAQNKALNFRRRHTDQPHYRTQ